MLSKDDIPFLIAGGIIVFTVGAFGGYRYAKKELEQEFFNQKEEEVDAVRDYYQRKYKTGRYKTPEAAVKARTEVPSPGMMNAVTEAISAYKRESDAIAEVAASEKEDEEMAQAQNVFEDGPEGTVPFDYMTEIPMRTPNAPYVVSIEEFMNQEAENYDQVTISYYAGDDVLANERDEMMDDPDGSVGLENLKKFGYGSSDPNSVYVRNDRLQLEFEVVRYEEKYSKVVMGLDE